MRNQQRSLDCDIGWLAGMIDGDGCIHIHYQTRRGNKLQYQPKTMIANRDICVIDRVRAVLVRLGIGSYTQERKTAKGNPIFNIYISGFKRCKKLLPLIIPHLSSYKRERALTVLAFIAYRESLPNCKSPYSDVEHKLYERVKAITVDNPSPPRDQMPSAALAVMLESELA